MRVLILQIIQGEGTGIRHLPRRRNRVGPLRKQAAHLLWRLEVSLRIRLQKEPRSLNRLAMADAGHHILQRPPRRVVVQHIIRRQYPQPMPPCDPVQPRNPRHIIPAIEIRRPHVAQRGQRIAQPPQPRLEHIQILGRHDNQLHALTLRCHHLQRQMRLAFDLPTTISIHHFPPRQQRRQPRIGLAVTGIRQQLRPTKQHQPRANQGPHLGRARLHMHPHHPRQRVVIGHPDAVIPQHIRRHRQIDSIRRRAQKRKTRRQPQLHIRAGRVPVERVVVLNGAALMSLLLWHQVAALSFKNSL